MTLFDKFPFVSGSSQGFFLLSKGVFVSLVTITADLLIRDLEMSLPVSFLYLIHLQCQLSPPPLQTQTSIIHCTGRGHQTSDWVQMNVGG